MKLALVIINEQHTLLPEQKKLLEKRYVFQEILLPKRGLDKAAMLNLATELILENKRWLKKHRVQEIIFVSPIPGLMAMLCQRGKSFRVLHNSRREKVENPDGRLVMTLAKKGWEII